MSPFQNVFRRGAILACTASLFAASPGLAQDTLIVEGQRIETADIRSMARDITAGSHAMFQPLARFRRPVCPGVWGMSEANAQAVLDRITFNALQAGVEVAQEQDCGANVWVIVVDDADATFEALDDEGSFLTRHLLPYQTRMVRAQQGSLRAWNQITTRNPDDGRVQPDGFELASYWQEARINPRPGASGRLEYDFPANEVSTMSRLDLGIRTDIELSVILVERSAMADLDVVALADYATMRLLLATDAPSRESPVPTILTLFDPEQRDAAPRQLTAFDRAYLAAMYRSSPTRPARLAIGGIQVLMQESSDL
ncbi:hypothetical protein [Aurantiacibacter sp. MUD61]|uniref:hypothetical protein n=1 Tax=Aurantiacibacter sp. MUD61 TaxID=3009083 RepID=UPI0022F11C64|nr:hypothetical protein [Aurantiacibacter sp. MUD61]